MMLMLKGVLLTAILLYISYVFFTAYLLFFLPLSYKQEDSDLHTTSKTQDFANQDHVLLLENGFESGRTRMQIIQEAKTSIDFVSYSVQKGQTSHLFLAALFEAADRGVHVRVLLDGLFHNLHGDLKEVKKAIAVHPNMELRYFEPFRPFKPWSWHNRLHDKLLLVDETYGIIGGRNIGDKYLSEAPPKDYVLDRDVLIYHKDNQSKSSLQEMKAYTNELWNHPFTQVEKKNKSKDQRAGLAFQQDLNDTYQKAKNDHVPFVQPLSQEWKNKAIKAEHVSFLSNPLTRLNKPPTMWKTFTKLASEAESKVYIQTPYAIPTKQMNKYVEMDSTVSWVLLTNSIQQTPNPMAYSGYLSKREALSDSGFTISEYQGPHSIHAKSFVIDDQMSMVGSFNLDARSSFLNTESAVLINSAAFANKLTVEMDKKASKSNPFSKDTSTNDHEHVVKALAIKALSKLSFLWRIFL
ncbi:phospholipase D family protein [Bacillus sp. C1-1]|uniref:Phospholipase D family protein n=2 Tax=Shouchella lehensis TaxID=300825 RepID=A0A4Y7WKS1_9BACI|nr:phospholipase D family protein [Bacillus sp. C1-1]TES49276.1 phospholipase D family protein [Shouchella lehensis]